MLDFSHVTYSAPTETVFDRIVCGLDDSLEALEGARQAARLRSPDGLLRLAAVAPINIAVHAGFAMTHVLDELDAAARESLHRAVDAVHPNSTQVLVGDAVPSLLDEIKGFDATLVAVGPHRHSRVLGALLGGVATAMLHDAPCSVLLARQPRQGEFPSKVLAGVDGSDESLAAAAVAKSIADRFGADFMVAVATGGKHVALERIQALTPYFITDPDKPVEALVGLADDFDLVVVGSRGLHGVASLGSVSERVAHRAPCSVLVVRRTVPHS